MNAEQFDKHLFNLSQQADDSNAMPFNEEAWQRMEQLLDGDKKKRRFVLWWWLLPLLLIGGGAALYFKNSSYNSKTNIESDKTNDQILIINSIKNKILKKDDKVDEDLTKNANKKLEEEFESALKKTDTVKINEQKYREPSLTKVAIIENRNSREEVVRYKVEAKAKKNIVDESFQKKKNLGFSEKNGSNSFQTAWNFEKIVRTSLNKIDTANVINLSLNTDKLIQLPSDTIFAVRCVCLPKPSLLSKFEVSAFAAADISAVDLSLKEPKSITFGIGLSYQITKKLSIATGFGVSRKLYSADSADYKNQPWVAASYKLKTVDANCLVYELPVNLQYQFAQTKKASWLAVGGVSSYFMKSESYDYNYLWYGQPRKTTYLIENKNNHLFSILNIAVGYRSQLGKQLSYQLTPFVKIPLTGIGEGQVKFYSAGLQLSLNLKGK